MTTIGILALAEAGHVNATIQLSRELSAAGHTVRYLGDPRDRAVFDDRGLPFAELPRRDTAFGPTYHWRDHRDALVLVDSILIRAAIDACLHGARVIQLSTTFPLGFDPDVPPVDCDLASAHDELSRRAVAAAWQAVADGHRAVQDPHPHVGRADSTLGVIGGFAADRGWPAERWDPRAAINPIAALPELVLAPAALEFPRRPIPVRRYGGPCVDLDRREPAFPWHRLRAGRPMVYVSFGSQTARTSLAGQIAIVLDAARRCSELDVAIATGGAELPASLPDNAICVTRAPQIALLRRAAVMVSHGGLNGLKEAAICGVPAIVLPLGWDQPGNAARIAFHGLGVAARWDEMTGQRLAVTLRSVLDAQRIAQRARAVREQLCAEHARPSAATALAELIADVNA
jgi:zeaxanthin glucosyltransferase